jgi:hypothetical protein
MASWKFWEWVAYACLFVAAVIVATDAGIKNAPTLSPHLPDWMGGEYWSFAPLLLLTLSGIIFLAKVIRVRLAGAGVQSTEAAPSTEGGSRTATQTDQPEPPTRKQILVPVDIYSIHDPNARGYPHKLCIAVKNESGKDLLVNPANWEKREASDIAFRRSDYHPWIPEGPNRWEKRDWTWSRSPDRAAIHLLRDRAIMTWVGLNGPLDEIELTQRIIGKRLGTLLVSFTANGNAGSETIKLPDYALSSAIESWY